MNDKIKIEIDINELKYWGISIKTKVIGRKISVREEKLEKLCQQLGKGNVLGMFIIKNTQYNNTFGKDEVDSYNSPNILLKEKSPENWYTIVAITYGQSHPPILKLDIISLFLNDFQRNAFRIKRYLKWQGWEYLGKGIANSIETDQRNFYRLQTPFSNSGVKNISNIDLNYFRNLHSLYMGSIIMTTCILTHAPIRAITNLRIINNPGYSFPRGEIMVETLSESVKARRRIFSTELLCKIFND